MEGTFALKEKIKCTDDVAMLTFAAERPQPFNFKAGQYVTIYFPDNRFGWQGKSYSITSAPGEPFVSVAVKKMGGFSGALHELEPGDTVALSGSAGYFYPAPMMRNLVFFAAGIGITPCYSIVNALAKKNRLQKKTIKLLYSNKTKADIAFFDGLQSLAAKHQNLTVIYFLTRSEEKDPGIHEFSRIDGANLKKYIKFPEKNYFFICGSISFVNDIWRALAGMRIRKDRLATEAIY